MAFMVIAILMAFVLRYTLAKYPYPELQTTGRYTGAEGPDGKGEEA